MSFSLMYAEQLTEISGEESSGEKAEDFEFIQRKVFDDEKFENVGSEGNLIYPFRHMRVARIAHSYCVPSSKRKPKSALLHLNMLRNTSIEIGKRTERKFLKRAIFFHPCRKTRLRVNAQN